MLNGLGATYENFVSSISQHYRRKDAITVDELISQLLDEQCWKDENNEPAIALVVRKKFPNCRHCGKPGHKEENC